MSTGERGRSRSSTATIHRVGGVFLAALLLVACGETGAAAPVNVIGVWDVSGNGVEAIATYREDGTYNIAPLVGQVPLTAFDLGTYEIKDTTLIYKSSAAATGCAKDDQGHYEIDIKGDNSWTATLLEDDCFKRSEGGPFVHTSKD